MGAAALLLLLAVNLHVVCRVSVDGQAVEGRYSPAALTRSRALALRTAEEILPGEAALPAWQVRRSLSLLPPEDEISRLTDALLRGTEGVAVRDAVFVDGLALGHVADGAALDAALRQALYGSRPAGAVNARYTEEITQHRVYTRVGRDMSQEDMLLLIRGCCPVLYTDADGKIVFG